MEQRKKWIKWGAIGLIGIVLLGMIGFRVMDSLEEADVDQQPLAVDTLIVSKGDKDMGVTMTGTIEGSTSSIISSPVSGKVVELYVEDGQTVSEGQPLFLLDTVELDNAVTAANNALRQAQAKYNQVETNFHRYETLVKQGVISQQQMDSARTDLIAAQTEVDIAQANVNTAVKRVDDSTVRSPSNGIVANRNLTVGQNLSAGVQVMTVESIGTVNAVVQIPQKWMSDISVGTAVNVTVDTFPDKLFTGTVSVINPVAGVENRMFRVKISVPNSEGLIKPGMFINAKLDGGTPVKAILIPKTAVVQEKGLSYVYVVNGTTAKRISVEVGELQGDMLEIVNGISEGERLITNQLDRLQDKSPITYQN